MSKKYKKIVIIGYMILLTGTLCGCGTVLDGIMEKTMEPEGREEYAGTEEAGAENPETRDEAEENPAVDIASGEMHKGLFYFDSLSPEQQKIYDQIYESIITRKEKVLDTVDVDITDKVYQMVMNDHPEIFYSAGYELEKTLRNEKTVKLTFCANYHMTETETAACQAGINSYVTQCLSGMPEGLDQYGQVKYIYEYIISSTEYELNSENNQNICSVFLNGKSVCQGYAKATQYLLQEMGYDITMVFGKVRGGEAHTWNLILVDGDYYYMDPTWGDAGYLDPGSQQSSDRMQPVNYEYFLITTDQITRTHTIDNTVPLPACVASRNNYYVRESLYFTVFDETKMKDVFERAYKQEEDYVTIMCSDEAVYADMKQRMISEQEIFMYLHSSQSVSYSYNDNLYTFIFCLW